MNQRIHRAPTMPRLPARNHTEVLRFERFRTLEQTKGGVVAIYVVVCCEQSLGYLYVTSDRYSLVWESLVDFTFDMSYSFIEYQFSGKPPSRIRDLRPFFPFRREKKDFAFCRATASVFLHGAESAENFDLLDENAKRKYTEKILDQTSSSTSRIGFARYDSEIEVLGDRFEVGFTAESLNSTDNWEYVISLPRKVVLKTFSLRWVVENHKLRELDQAIDYRSSIGALSELLKQ